MDRLTTGDRRLTAWVVMGVVLALPLAAQQDSARAWDRVGVLRPGQKVKVYRTDHKVEAGKYVRHSDEGIVLEQSKGETLVAKGEIARVRVRTGKARARNAMISAGAGAGVIGLIAGVTAVADRNRNRNGFSIGVGVIFVVGAIGVGIVCAGVAALFPGYSTVYKAP